MSSLPTRFRQENAFTIVEVMVAALLLVVGLLGAVTMLDRAIRTTATNSQRTGATNLLRELVENTRTAPYTELEPGRLEPAIQAMPNMGGGTPWSITRRGVRYTVTFTACMYDDPADKVAAVADPLACGPAPAGSATGDANGDDFRRVNYTVSWLDHGRPKTMRQNALIVNPTGGLGPRIIFVGPTVNPVTVGSTATFTATSTTAATVHWTTDDGVSEGDATGGPTSWTINWPLGTVGAAGSVVDGTYKLIAQAFDVSRSVPGDSKVATVVINRNAPFAPSNFIGGQNARFGINEFSWTRSRERDVIGYRVYAGGPDQNRGGGNDQQVCPAVAGAWLDSNTTSCRTGTIGYLTGLHYVVALDRETNGSVREGTEASITVPAAGTAPVAPVARNGVEPTADGRASVTWSAPASGPAPMLYRIYQGGTALGNRIGVAGSSATSFTDSSSPAIGQYYVTAVDSTFNESAPLGPLPWTAP